MSASINEIEDFLNGGLVSWLESCLPRPEILTGYNSLTDGSIIYSVCLQIDPEPQHHLTKLIDLDGVALINARAKNFDAIVRNLKALYEEELGQTVLAIPDCTILGNEPESKIGLEHMKLLLTLLLGAAVQCPNKEIFIARIKELDVVTQHAIVELIKQVTDNQTLVLTQESLEQLTPNKMYSHILRLVKERDNYHTNLISNLNEIGLSPGSAGHSVAGPNGNRLNESKMTPSNSTSSASSASGDNNHMAVELADLKSKLRKLRQELEEKNEAFMEAKEELEHKTQQFEKLRNESQEWYAEARRAATYRDEVDVLRERADRADRLEIEVQRFREKLSDAEFYKTRVEELREDNRLLLETKEMLEEQLQRSRKRSEHAMSLESDIIKYKQKLNDLALERDSDKNKLQDLIEENTQLQLATKNLSSTLENEFSQSDYEDDSISGDNSLSEQLTNNATSRALKLELENRRLNAALESLKETSFHESSDKILELEKEKKKISLKLEQLQDNWNRLQQQNQELENVFKNALEENKKLQDSLDAVKQANDKQSQDREFEKMKIKDLDNHIESLNKDKQRIQTLSESIQRRANDLERTLETKSKEIENLNEKLKEMDAMKKEIYEITTKFTSAEKENTNLTKEVVKYKESLEKKDVLLDENTTQLESQTKEITNLKKSFEEFSVLQQKLTEYEKINNELKSQNKIDTETISTLQKDLISGTLTTTKVKQGLEKLGLDNEEIENIEINVENVVEKLVKNPETFKTVREIILNVSRETSSTDICVLCHRQEIYTVEKEIEISSTPNDVEFNLMIDPNLAFSPHWKDQCDQLTSENTTLTNTNEDLQAESARQKVEVSTLTSQINSLNTQHVALQLANSQLAAEKDSLLKQLDAMKQLHDQLHHDQVTLQCLHNQLNSDYDALNKDKEDLRVSLRDNRNENRNLREHTEALEKLVKELKFEIESIKKDAISLGNLRAEHSKLKDDFRHLFTTSERLKDEYKNIHEQYRSLRTENSRMKLQNTELTGELNNRIDQVTGMEIELTKSNQQCEMLYQMNSSLDIDRRTLMDHVSQLLSQYHELLAHSLEDKKYFHDEEKSYTDKVNNLSRQKEKLEEKIMEHYRKLDSCSPKKKTFGSSFVKRVRKAGSDLMNKVPTRNLYFLGCSFEHRTDRYISDDDEISENTSEPLNTKIICGKLEQNRRSWIDDTRLTQSNFTLGSESGGNESDNSTEDPNSTVSDTFLIEKYSKLRQTLPRKPKEIESDGGNGGTLTRGGVRSSLQASRKDIIKNSISTLDVAAPEVAGSLNLGTAGSRRTVYLVDDNPKITEKNASNTTNTTTTTSIPSPGTPTPTNENVNSNNETPPSTFLMYNRISTMIGDNSQPASIQSQHTNGSGNGNGSGGDNIMTQSMNERKKTTNGKPKESTVWYEYGCV